MDLPTQPGLRRRLIYGNNANTMNMMRMNRYQINMDSKLLDRIVNDTRLEIYNKGMCAICHDNYKNEIVRILKCNHNYHYKCIDRWIIKYANCPICRDKI